MLPHLRIVLRGFRRRYATAAAVVATLAVCIGANSTIFSIVDAMLLKPLPYPEPTGSSRYSRATFVNARPRGWSRRCA